MNVTMVDVTNIANAAPGDTVTLIGTDGDERIEAEDVGRWAHSIGYEIVARLAAEIPRTFVDNSERNPLPGEVPACSPSR